MSSKKYMDKYSFYAYDQIFDLFIKKLKEIDVYVDDINCVQMYLLCEKYIHYIYDIIMSNERFCKMLDSCIIEMLERKIIVFLLKYN